MKMISNWSLIHTLPNQSSYKFLFAQGIYELTGQLYKALIFIACNQSHRRKVYKGGEADSHKKVGFLVRLLLLEAKT